MSFLRSRMGLALLGVLLSACVTSAPAVREDVEAPEVVSSSWNEARADPTCVVPLCDEERCALWRCRDVAEVDAHPVLLAQAAPVFEIPWHNWKPQELSAPRLFRHQCFPPREPFEKHHIFPQQRLLALWFKGRGIDIHAFTIRLPRSFHQWLHSGGPEGWQWNEAWRQFMDKNRTTAKAEDIWRFAGELMMRFGVNGPLVPYFCD